jgi:hypothetical protein
MSVRRAASIAASLVVLAGAWLWAPRVHAMNTKPLNIADLVRESSQIVVGRVLAVNQGMSANHLPYAEVQVKVVESISGDAAATVTFRQFGLQSPLPAANGRKYVGLVAGMPQYKAGDQVVLFLGKTSSIGFRTTIGLGQGKFTVRGGNLENEANNAGLFKDVDFGKRHLDDKEKHLVTTTQGAVGSDTFLSLLRRAVNGKWWVAPTTKKTPTPVQPGSTLPPGGKLTVGVAP